MKVVINTCYGGFCLSEKAYELLGLGWDGDGCAYNSHEDRADPKLVEVVERLGHEADGKVLGKIPVARLEVVWVPDDVEWTIEEYDGKEYVAERHRTWS